MGENDTRDDEHAKPSRQGRDHDISNEAADVTSDYCDSPLEDWKHSLRKDVKRRFGDAPQDLNQVGKPSW